MENWLQGLKALHTGWVRLPQPSFQIILRCWSASTYRDRAVRGRPMLLSLHRKSFPYFVLPFCHPLLRDQSSYLPQCTISHLPWTTWWVGLIEKLLLLHHSPSTGPSWTPVLGFWHPVLVTPCTPQLASTEQPLVVLTKHKPLLPLPLGCWSGIHCGSLPLHLPSGWFVMFFPGAVSSENMLDIDGYRINLRWQPRSWDTGR